MSSVYTVKKLRGGELYPADAKGYALSSAKDFARISSQHGGDTEVWRARPRKLVRRYSGGERVWPIAPKQLTGLYPAELPREIRRWARNPGENMRVTLIPMDWGIVAEPQSYQRSNMYHEVLSLYGIEDTYDLPLAEVPWEASDSINPYLSPAQAQRLFITGAEVTVRMPVEEFEHWINASVGRKIFP